MVRVSGSFWPDRNQKNSSHIATLQVITTKNKTQSKVLYANLVCEFFLWNAKKSVISKSQVN